MNRGRWFQVLNSIMTTDKNGTLSLSGGVDVPFRLIRSDDVPALQRFHGRLSEKTIYLRFFGSLEELPKEKAQFFAHVDGVDHLAFVALDPDDPDEIIALVRYDREPGSERSEYAALVEDRWQDHGVGTASTRELIDEARDKEVRSLYAMVMGKNTRMLELLRHLGLPEHERREDGIKHVEVEIGSKASLQTGQDEKAPTGMEHKQKGVSKWQHLLLLCPSCRGRRKR